jgi:hypothetical protein
MRGLGVVVVARVGVSVGVDVRVVVGIKVGVAVGAGGTDPQAANKIRTRTERPCRFI